MFHLRSASSLCTLRTAVSATRHTPRHTLRLLALQNQRLNFSATASDMGKDTLTEAIKDDHEEMYEYYGYYQKAAGDPDAQARWAHQLTWEVARHAVGEELVVYPLMEEHMGAEGKRLTNEDREQHQHVKQLLYDLSSREPGTTAYEGTMKAVMDHLKPHNDSEEQNDLPTLEQMLGKERSMKEAERFTRTKKFVPTRTHPSAPNQPPLKTFVGFLSAPIDKLKDAFDTFPTQEMKEAVKE